MHIALFDLDGTITRRDTLLPFVFGWLWRRPWQIPRLLAVTPALLSFACLRRDHGALKSALLHRTMSGASRDELANWSVAFVDSLLRSGVFPDALKAIQSHRNAHVHLILMSASVDLYVPDIGRALGFAQTLCTGVRWRGEVLDGRLSGTNCRGAEKLHQLRQLRTTYPGCRISAYGNSAADLLHLQAADQGYLVNGSAAARKRALRAGIRTLAWR